MKKVIKYTLKTLGWIILGIVTIVLLSALLLQTSFLKRKIATFAEKQANTFINGELTLGEIKGNFFTHLTLENILVTQKGDTMGYIQEIKAGYNLLALMSGKLDLRSVELNNPRFFLKQINDSVWNVQQLIKPSADTTTDTTTSNFSIHLAELQLKGGVVHLDAQDTLIPREINNLNISLSGSYSADSQALKMDKFSLNTREPDVSIEKLVFDFTRDKESIVLKGFEIKTTKNKVQGAADFAEAPDREGNANFKSAPITISEFQFALPDLQLPATPVFALEAHLQGNQVKAVVQIEDQDQKLYFDVVSDNLYAFVFHPEEAELKYSIDGTLENIDLAYWLNDPELKYLINGQLKAVGQGTDPATAKINLTGEFKDLMVQDYTPLTNSCWILILTKAIYQVLLAERVISARLKCCPTFSRYKPIRAIKSNSPHKNWISPSSPETTAYIRPSIWWPTSKAAVLIPKCFKQKST